MRNEIHVCVFKFDKPDDNLTTNIITHYFIFMKHKIDFKIWTD